MSFLDAFKGNEYKREAEELKAKLEDAQSKQEEPQTQLNDAKSLLFPQKSFCIKRGPCGSKRRGKWSRL